jgi:hypothetical protein
VITYEPVTFVDAGAYTVSGQDVTTQTAQSVPTGHYTLTGKSVNNVFLSQLTNWNIV